MTDTVMVLPFNVLGPGPTVTDVQMDVGMFNGQATHMLAHGVFATVSRPVYEPHRPLGARGNDGIEHADHRGESHPGTEQHPLSGSPLRDFCPFFDRTTISFRNDTDAFP